MAGGENEARGILDEPSILKRNAHREKNRPESALISNLGGLFKITPRFAGLIAFFAEPSKPGLCPESPVSPIVGAGRRVF
jgi:hypothetical protein